MRRLVDGKIVDALLLRWKESWYVALFDGGSRLVDVNKDCTCATYTARNNGSSGYS